MIHIFHFAWVGKQPICRDLNLFDMEAQKVSNEIQSRSFEWNLHSSNRISKCAQIAIKSQSPLGFTQLYFTTKCGSEKEYKKQNLTKLN